MTISSLSSSYIYKATPLCEIEGRDINVCLIFGEVNKNTLAAVLRHKPLTHINSLQVVIASPFQAQSNNFQRNLLLSTWHLNKFILKSQFRAVQHCLYTNVYLFIAVRLRNIQLKYGSFNGEQQSINYSWQTAQSILFKILLSGRVN